MTWILVLEICVGIWALLVIAGMVVLFVDARKAMQK
jgi:hypothetical protein